jgi:capsular polysaccharide biosynthesis protein
VDNRLYPTTFANRRPGLPPSYREPKPAPRRWVHPALDSLAEHRWLIVALALAGVALGYVYTVRLCVPLYRIQASIELQNSQSSLYPETLAQVLQSQSLINSALSSLPETERNSLVETPPFSSLVSRDASSRLRERLSAVAMPSANVVDIDLISPAKPAATDFLNTLIRLLIERNQEQKRASGSLLPDDLGSSPAVIDNISVIDPAIGSADPVAPNGFTNIALGCLIGWLAGVAIALFRKFATTTFRGPGSVGQVLGMRELGTIPERKLLPSAGIHPARAAAPLTQLDPNDESLRYLRSSLLYKPRQAGRALPGFYQRRSRRRQNHRSCQPGHVAGGHWPAGAFD